MPIPISTLQTAAQRVRSTRLTESVAVATAARKQTAFLCHSHKDRTLAIGLQVLLEESGWNLYVDWQDTEMPEVPDKETAARIKIKIQQLDWFLFLATPNSAASRWCPWEIGVADKTKPHERIAIVPTTDHSGNWHGNEYLQLYNQITPATDGELARFPAGKNTGGVYVRHLR